jgi:hypothetical protein
MEARPNIEQYTDSNPNTVGGVIDHAKQRIAVVLAVGAASLGAAPSVENFDNVARANQVPATEVNPISEAGVTFADCANASFATKASYRASVTTDRTNGRITNAIGRFRAVAEKPSIVKCDGVSTYRAWGTANRQRVTQVLTLVGRNQEKASFSSQFSATQMCKKYGYINWSMVEEKTYSVGGRSAREIKVIPAKRKTNC